MDAQSRTGPLLCHEIIGREQEIRLLSAALSCAIDGQPQFLWLAGEAGLGKTKLCRAFMKLSQSQLAIMLYGQAIPQDQVLPFSPFLDLFRRYFDASSRVRTPFDQVLQSTFSFLWQFLPDLSSFFPEIPAPSFGSTGAPEVRRQMLFHGILRGLQTLAQACQGPFVLILEDVHWADETSLELLEFLAQRLSISLSQGDVYIPLLILATYRTEALPDSPTLQQVLSRLRALRSIQAIHLAPLNAMEHQRCVSAILQQPAPEAFTRFLFGWDEGNPFFTEELLSAMVATGQLQAQSEKWIFPSGEKPVFPSSLTDAILERFLQLPLADQEVLAYAAIIGRQFDFFLLTVLCQLEEHELVEVLRRAVRAQFIHEVGNLHPKDGERNRKERYQFRHALTREAIYERMLQPERRLRHRTVAETIEKLIMNGDAGVVASIHGLDNAAQLLVEHYYQAGLPERAYRYALQEAERANHVCAFHEECYYLEVAQVSLSMNDPERLRLLERLGMVNMGFYDFSAALHWFSLAEEGYRCINQPSQALRVLATMLLPAWFLASDSLPQMRVEVETAMEHAFLSPHHTDRDVNLLDAGSMISMYQITHCQYQRIIRWVERNVALCNTLDDPRKVEAIQISYIARSWAQAHQQEVDIERCITELHDILALAHQQNAPNALILGYLALAMILIFWGRIREAEQVAKKITEYENRYSTLRTGYVIGWIYFYSGRRWSEGIEFLRSNIEHRKQKGIRALIGVEGTILAHLFIARYNLKGAQEYLEVAQPILEQMKEHMFLLWMAWGFAKLYEAQGDPLQAQEWYERVFAYWEASDDVLFILPIMLDMVACYAQTGDLALAEAKLAVLSKLVAGSPNSFGKAILLEAQGIIAVNKGKLPFAIETLRFAVELWERLEFQYHYALAAHRLAEALLEWTEQKSLRQKEKQHARKEAEQLLQGAFTVYEQLDISPGKAAVQLLRIRTRLDAQQKRRNTLGSGESLTRKEMEVLRWVAAGSSNKEIAKKLNIKEGTAELHVTHILAKLRCETRTQAAAIAFARGWVKAP